MKSRRSSVLWLAVAGACLATTGGLPAPLSAEDKPAPVVKATDARGLLTLLEQAGYDAKLEPRSDKDDVTSIAVTTRDGDIFINFSDCKEAVPDFCETLVLSSSWDRTTPISDSAITEANQKFRYVSVWRNEKGDPVMQWAILTRDTGIAPALFLNALQRFLDVVRDYDAVAFEGDAPEEKADDAPPST